MINPQVDAFMKLQGSVALTFDDVTLITRYADFLPSETNLESRFTRRVKLNIPFVSAAMDTVTEAAMAIEMARLGGLGVIHRGLPVAQQAKQVARVKHYLNGLITDPIVFHEDQTVAEVLRIRAERRSAGSRVCLGALSPSGIVGAVSHPPCARGGGYRVGVPHAGKNRGTRSPGGTGRPRYGHRVDGASGLSPIPVWRRDSISAPDP